MEQVLRQRFAKPPQDHYKRRIIVWRDEDGAFSQQVQDMQLDNARVLVMQPDHMFELRRQIEVDYAEENILLYCPLTFKQDQDNWLLDVFLYSEEFRADFASLLFDEVGIQPNGETRACLRDTHVKVFFASKDRKQKFAALHEGKLDSAQEVQKHILYVACGLKTPSLHDAMRVLFTDEARWDMVDKYLGEEAFYQLAQAAYGYMGKHDLALLCAYLLTSAAMPDMEAKYFANLPCSASAASAALELVERWRSVDRNSLRDACQRVEEQFNLQAAFARMTFDALCALPVFPVADVLLLGGMLKAFAQNDFDTNLAERLLRTRSGKMWQEDFRPYYTALRSLIDMRLFEEAHRDGFHYENAEALWRDYRRALYQMDTNYRAFCNAYDAALNCGMLALEDDLKETRQAVERLYAWYLSEVNTLWTQLTDSQSLADVLPGCQRQERFYSDCIANRDSRTFVIISDSLRYDVGCELAEKLNGTLGGNTECAAMVGTAPTITPVGMAALLPHRKLTMQDDLRILADGLPTEAPNREAVLQATCPTGVVIGMDAFRQMTRAQRQEKAKGAKVVYLYHDVIDRVGESGGNVADACAEAIEQISQMMRVLVNELSVSNVYITSDHGFLYTRSPLQEYDRTPRDTVKGEVMEYKRRYAIVRGEGEHGLSVLNRPDLQLISPPGVMRFALQGSSGGYMHGGLSLQELAVPLVHYENKKAGQKGFKAITKTNVLLLGDKRKITNNIFTLSFFQQECCEGKVQPRYVSVRFEDAYGAVITDEHHVVANSVSRDNNARLANITFHLLGSGYCRTTAYFLVMRDEEDKQEILREAFTIDIIFDNDFDF